MMHNDIWTLKVYDHGIDGCPVGIFDFRSKQLLREWCYAHVGVAHMEWDNVDHVCRVYLDGGTIK